MSGDLLFDLVWEAIYHLERMQLKVLAITADGATTNHLFFKIHNPNAATDDITHKVCNLHAPDGRNLYFFSDTPHSLKQLEMLGKARTELSGYVNIFASEFVHVHFVTIVQWKRHQLGTCGETVSE